MKKAQVEDYLLIGGIGLFILLVIFSIYWKFNSESSPTYHIAESRYELRMKFCNEWELTDSQHDACIRRAVEERLKDSVTY